MGQPTRATSELALDVGKLMPWVRKRLLSWFARDGCSFPWREPGRTPYEVVVAEILLQRTTTAGVARVYSGFIEP